MVKKREVTALQIAEHFIARINAREEGEISNMKLQKLLWFAQKMSFRLYDRPLFDGVFKARKYGPVSVDVYDTYKSQGKAQLVNEDDKPLVDLGEHDDEVIELTIEKYGKYSAWGLSDLSHEDPLYCNTKGGASISNNRIRETCAKEREADIRNSFEVLDSLKNENCA